MIEFDHNGAILHCRGEEDRSTQPLRRQAFARALKTHRDVVVKMSELTFADSSLMLDLAALARRLRLHGGALWLESPQPQIRTLIELVGLNRLAGVKLQSHTPAAA